MVNGFGKEEVDKFLVRVKRIENEQYKFHPREKIGNSIMNLGYRVTINAI